MLACIFAYLGDISLTSTCSGVKVKSKNTKMMTYSTHHRREANLWSGRVIWGDAF